MLFALFSFLIRMANMKTCPIFECSPIDEEDICVIPKPNTNSTFIVNKCKNNNKYCALVSDEPNMKTTCQDKEIIDYKLYPGFPCETNDDCFNGNCYEEICQGSDLMESCKSTDDCNIGFKCTDGQCFYVNQSQCEVDEDCPMDSGCLNQSCVRYFSLEDGTNISSVSQNSFLSFCKGGYSINGLCVTLKLVGKYNEPCDSENKCIYTDQEGNRYDLPEMCKCGYGEHGHSYCKLGGGEKNFTRYINSLFSYYEQRGCAQSEHGALIGCNYDKRGSTMKKSLISLYNQYLWANYNYRMYNAALCVIQVEFPDYNIDYDKPETISKKCATYKCELSTNKDNVCLKSTYNLNDGVNVKLFYNLTFMENQQCQVDPKKELYMNKDIEKKWEDQNKIIPGIRFPGEDCEDNQECENWKYPDKQKLSVCKKGKCGGYGKGESCQSHDMCLVGLYCDTKEEKCKSQKDIDESCQSSYECLNHLLCFKKKCADVLYKFDIGYKFKPEDMMDDDDFFFNKLCKYGEANFDSGSCTAYEYENKTNPDEDFIECNTSYPCSYKVLGGSNNKQKDCECGYNLNGISYCPLDHKSRIEQWDEFFSIKRQLANNKCHTMNRYNCYKNKRDRKHLTDMHSMYQNSLTKGHLFYKSEPCVEKMLNANYMNINILLYIMSSIIFLYVYN